MIIVEYIILYYINTSLIGLNFERVVGNAFEFVLF